MSARTHRPPRSPAYTCSTRRRTGGHKLCQQPQLSRELIDGAVLRYFASVGLDEDATLAMLQEGSERRLAEARAQREQAERDLLRAEGKLAKLDREYGEIPVERYNRLSHAAESEHRAAQAEVERLRAQERAALAEAEARDVDAEALSALARVRAVMAGRIDSAADVGTVRAALTEVFSAFVLRRADDVHREMHRLPLAAGEWFIDPVVRPGAFTYTPTPDGPFDAIRTRRRVALRLEGQEGREQT